MGGSCGQDGGFKVFELLEPVGVDGFGDGGFFCVGFEVDVDLAEDSGVELLLSLFWSEWMVVPGRGVLQELEGFAQVDRALVYVAGHGDQLAFDAVAFALDLGELVPNRIGGHGAVQGQIY
ncbi:MAG: hypothetical protein FWD74_00610 [Actinomycetia bacterium]|nr:hypothetical protein [Actinomycetes bacterium]